MNNIPKFTITIDSEENDDWMKSLSGYTNELEITKAASTSAARNKTGKKSKTITVRIEEVK